MIWSQAFDYRNRAAAYDLQGADSDGRYIEPWGAGNHSAVLLNDIASPDVPGPDWGDPSEDPALQNLLVGNAYVLIGPVFVSTGPGPDYDVDDTSEPSFRTIWYERGFDMATRPYSPMDVQDQRFYLTSGALQLPIGQSYRDYPMTEAISTDPTGPTAILGYGPLDGALSEVNMKNHGWDLGWQESVRIVQIMAAGGIDQEEGRRIGEAWNTARGASASPETWMSAADIALIQSGEDTARKAAALAYWNFHGEFPPNVDPGTLASWGIADYALEKPAAHHEFDVPEAPRPPGFISTRAISIGEGGGVEVRWTREAEEAPDHDTGVFDFAGYRVWRQVGSRTSPWELIVEGLSYHEVEAAGALPAGLVHYDDDVSPGEMYWYGVTAYDDGTQNWAEPGQSLESARWWTWTGYSEVGVTATVAGSHEEPPPISLPGTDISGEVSTETWDRAGSPYRLSLIHI